MILMAPNQIVNTEYQNIKSSSKKLDNLNTNTIINSKIL